MFVSVSKVAAPWALPRQGSRKLTDLSPRRAVGTVEEQMLFFASFFLFFFPVNQSETERTASDSAFHTRIINPHHLKQQLLNGLCVVEAQHRNSSGRRRLGIPVSLAQQAPPQQHDWLLRQSSPRDLSHWATARSPCYLIALSRPHWRPRLEAPKTTLLSANQKRLQQQFLAARPNLFLVGVLLQARGLAPFAGYFRPTRALGSPANAETKMQAPRPAARSLLFEVVLLSLPLCCISTCMGRPSGLLMMHL
ncbi:hypothetical protein B0J18DRAFT_116489 [Chaetomium sp. MPI-SDFR-AT-0129]|nr:hypothetical protein B0J18DRAFT_116489 [Chaetomium sp. MPI-SDFR-AT-0129]